MSIKKITSLIDFDNMTKKDCLLVKKINLTNLTIDKLPNNFFWCKNVECINMRGTITKSKLNKIAQFDNLRSCYIEEFNGCIYKNYMMCLYYDKDTVIPDNITHFHISNVDTDNVDVIDNLPNNIKYLSIGNLCVPLDNLPPGLEKLKIINASIMYICKIPYGCAFTIKHMILHNINDICKINVNKDEVEVMHYRRCCDHCEDCTDYNKFDKLCKIWIHQTELISINNCNLHVLTNMKSLTLHNLDDLNNIDFNKLNSTKLTKLKIIQFGSP